jgi:UPF0716 protein FxsA
MFRRLLLIYAIVELAAILALAATIGWGWTLLVLLTVSVLGVVVGAPMAGVQLSAQVMQLRAGLKEPRSAFSDGAMVTLATVLLLVPGLVTTTLGILLMAPPIRGVARPALAAFAMRGLERRIPLITDVRMPGGGFEARESPENRNRGDYIDGEVIDVVDVEPPNLPSARVHTAPNHRTP